MPLFREKRVVVVIIELRIVRVGHISSVLLGFVFLASSFFLHFRYQGGSQMK